MKLIKQEDLSEFLKKTGVYLILIIFVLFILGGCYNWLYKLEYNFNSLRDTIMKIINTKLFAISILGLIYYDIRRSWDKNDKINEENRAFERIKKEKSIDFLDTIATDMKDIIPILFTASHIIGDKKVLNKDEIVKGLEQSRIKVLNNMFSVKIKSKNYLNDNGFSEKYEKIAHAIRDTIKEISKEQIDLNEIRKILTSLEQTNLRSKVYKIKEKKVATREADTKISLLQKLIYAIQYRQEELFDYANIEWELGSKDKALLYVIRSNEGIKISDPKLKIISSKKYIMKLAKKGFITIKNNSCTSAEIIL